MQKDQKYVRMTTPGSEILLSSKKAPTTGKLESNFKEINNFLKMGVKAGGIFWSSQTLKQAYSLVEELKEELLVPYSKAKLNQMLHAFDLEELKDLEIKNLQNYQDDIGNFFNGREAKDKYKEKINKIIITNNNERIEEEKKKTEFNYRKEDRPIFKVYEDRVYDDKSFQDFQSILRTLLYDFLGESNTLPWAGFLIKYLAIHSLTKKVIRKIYDNLRFDSDVIAPEISNLNYILENIIPAAKALAQHRLAISQNIKARQIDYLTGKLFSGFGSLDVDQFNLLRQQISEAINENDLLKACLVVSTFNSSKFLSGDALVAGITEEKLPFAFAADGCFLSDDYTGEVLEDFAVPLIPHITGLLRELDFAEIQQGQIVPSQLEAVAKIVKNFIFKAIGESTTVFYSLGQRFNLAFFIEYINCKSQRCRFWVGLGDISMVTLKRASSDQEWELENTWPGIKPKIGHGRYGAGVYLPIKEEFKDDRDKLSWAEQVEAASSAGIITQFRNHEAVVLLTDGIYQEFLKTDIEEIKGQSSVKFNIAHSSIPLISSLLDESKQVFVKNIEEELIKRKEFYLKYLSDLLKNQNENDEYRNKLVSLKEFLDFPAILHFCEDSKHFSKVLQEKFEFVKIIDKNLDKINNYILTNSDAKEMISDFKSINLSSHSIYGPFLKRIYEYKKDHYDDFKQFLKKIIEPYLTTPPADIKYAYEFLKYEVQAKSKSNMYAAINGLNDQLKSNFKKKLGLYETLYQLPGRLFLAAKNDQIYSQDVNKIREDLEKALSLEENLAKELKLHVPDYKNDWIISKDSSFEQFCNLLRSRDIPDHKKTQESLKEIFGEALRTPEKIIKRASDVNLDKNLQLRISGLIKFFESAKVENSKKIDGMRFGDDALCAYVLPPSIEQYEAYYEMQAEAKNELKFPHFVKGYSHSKKLEELAKNIRKGIAKKILISTEELTVCQYFIYQQMEINLLILNLMNDYESSRSDQNIKKFQEIINNFFILKNRFQANLSKIDSYDQKVIKVALQVLRKNIDLIIEIVRPGISQIAPCLKVFFENKQYEKFEAAVSVFYAEKQASEAIEKALYSVKTLRDLEKIQKLDPRIIDMQEILNSPKSRMSYMRSLVT